MGLHKGVYSGNKGLKGRSGRKSLIKEARMAEMLKEAFFKGVDIKKMQYITEALTKRKGRIKLFDVALAKAIKSDAILMGLFQKLYPDKLNLNKEVIHKYEVSITTYNDDGSIKSDQMDSNKEAGGSVETSNE